MTLFGICAAAALFTWLGVVLWRASATGVEQRHALRLLECAIAAGVAGAALPLFAGKGYSSFGGAFGAALASALYLRTLPRSDRLPTLDAAIYAFPFGWTLVRLGCFLQREHPGVRTDSILGIRYPDGFRYDLAELEMILSAALAATFFAFGRKPKWPGFFLQWIVLAGPLRLALESLRERPMPDSKWTAGQIGGVALTAIGVMIFLTLRRQRSQE